MEKNALITGATAGIGSELADIMAADGYALALVARDATRLAQRARALEERHKVPVKTFAKDLSNPAAPREIFDDLQRQNFSVTALVNNAGAAVFGPFAGSDLARQMELLRLNMAALVELTGLFLKPMLERHAGRILNIASTAAYQPVPGLALYAASKSFVLSFSSALAVELEGTGVTVTTLSPGGTETEFQQRAGMKHAAARPMTARRVAEIGYAAMLRGRPTVVAGWKNNLMVAVSQRIPTMSAARIAGMINKRR